VRCRDLSQMVMILDWSFLVGHQKWQFGSEIYDLHKLIREHSGFGQKPILY